MNFQDFCYLPHVGFEGRNQAYGAYELRKKYSKTLSVTLLVVIFSSAAIFATPLIQRAFLPEETTKNEDPIVVIDNTPINVIKIDDPKDEPLVIKQPFQEPPQVSTKTFTDIVIVETATKPIHNNKDIEESDVAISKTDKDGEGGDREFEKITVDTTKSSLGTGEPKEDNEIKEPFTLTQDASYEGGINEFRKELQKKVIYPSLARKKGTDGTVTLQFVVEKNGTISNITVLKGIGDGCDEEAIKALQKMTKPWSPGRDAKGKTVRVRKSLPIKFLINN